MKRILAALLCLAGLASAQMAVPPAQEKPKWLQEVIDVKHADPKVLAKLIASLQQNTSGDKVIAQPDLSAISIGTYDPSFLKLAKEIASRYDVPQAKPETKQNQGVELVAHILLAGPKGSSGSALPPSLEPVAKQLQAVFGHTDIALLDSVLIRGITGHKSEAAGLLQRQLLDPALNVPCKYSINIRDISVEEQAQSTTFSLHGFSFDVQIPYTTTGQMGAYSAFMSVGFNTDLQLRQGQQVVVGKSHIGSGNDSLILVLSARVVD